ncbi:MAG TPA: hypothetical protein VE783_06140 [Candidatus Limnocylindrales bacterium]|nr:hypothetical protein [Candidatus Limnocylindrales bacterium]
MDSEGALKGDILVKYTGSEALERRLDANDTDAVGFNKQLEDELKALLPNGASVKAVKVEGTEGSAEPLLASFSVEVPSFGSITGKRMLLPSSLFQGSRKSAFQAVTRKFPVYFAYAYAEIDNLKLKIPAGYKLETAPANADAGIPYASYHNEVSVNGSELAAHRELKMNGVFFKVDQYGEVRDFFSRVQAGDEQQAVLQGGALSAQSGN